jgi:hypothetical protein
MRRQVRTVINPTDEWLQKHGFYMWGVNTTVRGVYRYTVSGEGKRVRVDIPVSALSGLKTDREKRSVIYKAIEEAT